MNTFLNTFVNNFGANSSLSRELSMAPHTTICLGCNKSFHHISLYWNQKPVCCSSHQQRSTTHVVSLSSGVLPGLGAVVHDPLETALGRLPTFLDYKSALLELDLILQKPCTCTSFDLVVAWLEAALHDNTFKDLSKLPRQKSLMKRLNAKFRTPPHKLKTVALETGREEGGVDDFQ
jgi:hypothetical protein